MKGTELESMVKKQAADIGISLRKVDPPSLANGRFVMYKKNPFLDFIGCIPQNIGPTPQFGRMIQVECKSHKGGRLPLLGPKKKGSGLSHNQGQAIIDWAEQGALVGVIWCDHKEFWWIDAGGVMMALTQNMKSIPSDMCRNITTEGNLDFKKVVQ